MAAKHTPTHTRVRTHKHTNAHTRTHMHTHAHTYIHTHIHTHTQTHTRKTNKEKKKQEPRQTWQLTKDSPELTTSMRTAKSKTMHEMSGWRPAASMILRKYKNGATTSEQSETREGRLARGGKEKQKARAQQGKAEQAGWCKVKHGTSGEPQGVSAASTQQLLDHVNVFSLVDAKGARTGNVAGGKVGLDRHTALVDHKPQRAAKQKVVSLNHKKKNNAVRLRVHWGDEH